MATEKSFQQNKNLSCNDLRDDQGTMRKSVILSSHPDDASMLLEIISGTAKHDSDKDLTVTAAQQAESGLA
jgi:hypothetical protein